MLRKVSMLRKGDLILFQMKCGEHHNLPHDHRQVMAKIIKPYQSKSPQIPETGELIIEYVDNTYGIIEKWLEVFYEDQFEILVQL